MGMPVCLTAIFAAAAVPAALTLASGHFRNIFLLFGALWGLFIFDLDRWIISSIDYRTLRRDLRATPLEFVAFVLRSPPAPDSA
jgi:hypothetical protein